MTGEPAISEDGDDDPYGIEADLDEAYADILARHPGIDETSVSGIISEALEEGFQLGRDFGNHHPS